MTQARLAQQSTEQQKNSLFSVLFEKVSKILIRKGQILRDLQVVVQKNAELF